MMKPTIRLLVAAVTIFSAPLSARAQFGTMPSPMECSQWASSVGAGRAEATAALKDGRLSECPSAVHVLRSALRRAGSERDPDYLYALARQAAAVWDST